MGSREFMEWQIVYAYEPWGTLHQARQAAWGIMHAMQPHMRRGTRLKLDDFMLMRGFDGIEKEADEVHARKLLGQFAEYNMRVKAQMKAKKWQH